MLVTGSLRPIRSPCDDALILTPSPRLPATVAPSERTPMSLPSTVTSEALIVTPELPELTSERELTVEPSAPLAKFKPLVPRKSIVTTGEPANDGAVEPSIATDW